MTAISAWDEHAEADDGLERARSGEHDAFAALVERHDRGLRALAYRLLGDRDRMDDALQEAYLRAYRALPRFRGDAAFRTWLYRIAYNVCVEELARERRRLGAVPLEDVGDVPALVDVADGVTQRARLAAALAALAPEDRAAVLLVDAQGFDYRSAGAVLGVPEGTVASRLNRARAALRQTLGDGPKGGPTR
jgi:RNA polymerase sigma-70 factor (ECF subfamily)